MSQHRFTGFTAQMKMILEFAAVGSYGHLEQPVTVCSNLAERHEHDWHDVLH